MHRNSRNINRRSTLIFTLFTIVLGGKARGHVENCSPQELMICAKPLSFLTHSELTHVANRTYLDKICPDLKEAIICVNSFSNRCMNQDHRKHFKTLFHATGTMVHDLCHNGSYREEYLSHIPCMQKVKSDIEICFKKYDKAINGVQPSEVNKTSFSRDFIDLNERADKRIMNVCCAFQLFVECSTETVRRKCGETSAKFNRKFFNKASSSMLQLHCKDYGAQQCGYISRSKITTEFYVALILMLNFILVII